MMSNSTSHDKNLMRELEEVKEQAVQFERTARWWNESCVKWREKWGKENTEKKKLMEELEMLNGRNRALIVEFQRTQSENSKLHIMLKSRNTNETTQHQIKDKRNPAFCASDVPREDEEKRVARVEPIVEEVRMAKTMNNESPTFQETQPDKVNTKLLSPLSDIEEQLDSLDLEDGCEKRYYMGDASLPSSFQEELVNLKRLIESLETSSTESTTNDSKNSILNSILERVEGCFDDCENFVQESKRELEATRMLNAHKLLSRKQQCDQETQTHTFMPNMFNSSRSFMASPSSSSIDGGVSGLQQALQQGDFNKMMMMSSLGGFVEDRCTSVDVVVRDLRENIQRLQEENANEWALREQCESELCSVKRELRQAESCVKELREESCKKDIAKHEIQSLKLLNEELDEKSKELIEIKSAFSRSRKSLENRSQEVAHEKMRTTQYEGEVKKLRVKVEQLKKDLLVSEEKNDFQSNQLRRTQRTLEEQQQLNETLQIQINQTSSRLKYRQRRGSYN